MEDGEKSLLSMIEERSERVLGEGCLFGHGSCLDGKVLMLDHGKPAYSGVQYNHDL